MVQIVEEGARSSGVTVKQFPKVRGYFLPLILTIPVADLQYRSKVIQDFMEAAIGQETGGGRGGFRGGKSSVNQLHHLYGYYKGVQGAIAAYLGHRQSA